MKDAVHHELVGMSEDVIRAGSTSFAAAARLFDRETRTSACLLYSWCRTCDDMIDGQDKGFYRVASAGHDTREVLTRLQAVTHAALAGSRMSDPVFAGLQHVVQAHSIPHRLPLELLEGFRMDAVGRCYETIDDTLTYCYHVAGVVGVMMAIVMGVRDVGTQPRACDLGIAFQLTNIARDIVDDARSGRIYLPREWLSDAGIPPSEIVQQSHRTALAEVARRLLVLADQYYASSMFGLANLPIRSRWAVATARDVYRQIGVEVMRRGPHAWDRRVSTSRRQKLVSVAKGGASALAAAFFTRDQRLSPRQGLYTHQV